MPEAFHFQQPLWFLLLAPMALLLWWSRQVGQGADSWRSACEQHLLPHLLKALPQAARRSPLWLLAVAWLLAVLALADPVWQQRARPVYRNQAALMLVLDLSRSMLSPDLTPSRLERARYKVAEILKRRREGQTGLVVFAGDAFVVSPLTDDTGTIQALLQSLHPDLMPTQDSRADRGIALAAERLQQAGVAQGDILLVTDGYSDGRILPLAAELREQGYRLSVLAVGTDSPAPIADGRGDFLRDRRGAVILPALEVEQLRQLAAAGGGRYSLISADDADLARLLPATSGLAVDVDADSPLAGAWQSRGPWLLLLLLPLAATAFRRGWLLAPVLLVATLLGTLPSPARAMTWTDLWLRRDQQAEQALQSGKPALARRLARQPLRRAEAAYRSGDYAAALALFEELDGGQADYNRGNTLVRLQRYQEAIAAYEQALAEDPGLEDAAHNRALLKKLLELKSGEGEGEASDQASKSQGKNGGGGRGDSADRNADRSQDGQRGEAQDGEPADPAQGGDNNAGNNAATRAPDEQQAAEENRNKDAQAETEQRQQQAQTAQEAAPNARTADDSDTPPDLANAEQAQADERQLRRVPDDPGGLMRRKFRYQYRKRAIRELPTGPQGQGW